MRAQVPYLARLAQQTAGAMTLQPPRQLFAADIYTPVRSPGRGDSGRRGVNPAEPNVPHAVPASMAGEEQLAPERIESPRGTGTGGERAGSDPGTPVASAETSPDAGLPAPPVASTVQAGAAGAPPQAPRLSSAASIQSPHDAGIAPAMPTDAGPITQPGWTLPPSTSRPAGDAARVQPPESWTSPLWGMPVDLPQATELAPAAGDTDHGTPAASRPGLAALSAGPATAGTAGSNQGQPTGDAGVSSALPPGPGPAGTARPRQGQPTGDTAISVTFGARNGAGSGHSGEPAAVRDLIPPPAAAPRPIEMLGLEPDGSQQMPPVSGRARVSIGTIEVTVVSPAPPVPPAHEIRPPAQVAHRWSRPPSLLAMSAGPDRLRDGLRRWYGTAQS